MQANEFRIVSLRRFASCLTLVQVRSRRNRYADNIPNYVTNDGYPEASFDRNCLLIQVVNINVSGLNECIKGDDNIVKFPSKRPLNIAGRLAPYG